VSLSRSAIEARGTPPPFSSMTVPFKVAWVNPAWPTTVPGTQSQIITARSRVQVERTRMGHPLRVRSKSVLFPKKRSAKITPMPTTFRPAPKSCQQRNRRFVRISTACSVFRQPRALHFDYHAEGLPMRLPACPFHRYPFFGYVVLLGLP